MRKYLGAGLLLLLLNTAYIAAFAQPTIFYMGNVLLHLLLGIVLFGAFLWLLKTDRGAFTPLVSVLLGAAFGLGLFLTITGATREYQYVLWGHILLAFAGVAALIPVARKATPQFRNAFITCLAIAVVFPIAMHTYDALHPDPYYRISNPRIVPVSMTEEGGGPQSPFWPSSSKTNVGGIIPSNFFMDSQACGECHKDIYQQWKSSMHHFASFNNQFYRKSIEYMQSVAGVKPTKWCAGCHDHAVFFNGRFDKPIKDQIDTPEAQNGLGCMSCHSIVHVASTLGNADFTMMYPPLHELASSKNGFIRAMDHFLTYLDPEPHRRTFLKPFMTEQAAEFCSSCHKVHLDIPVNSYRWVRGFNDYDNWQASGVSGQGARSFYYPAESQTCVNCHMPLVDSHDPGNRDGKVHSHHFPAANVAVAYANQDQEQLKEEEKFLTSGFITVDIFAASPVDNGGKQLEMRRRTGADTQQLNSTFAAGEESEQSGPTFIREVGKLAAPIDTSGATFEPGNTVRVDTVVRTRKIGHFFPAGTVDSFDVWLELQGHDADGRTVFWSGMVEDNGRGPVEPGAHFYKSYQIDEDGNEINKRNAFQTRSTLYVHLIPPGAADVAHFLVKIPKGARGPITLTAKLNYRKFSHYYTQFAYAGQPAPDQDAKLVSTSFDDRKFSFDKSNIPANVSGRIKGEIPDVPIITLASAKANLPLGGATKWEPVVRKKDRERWNDWGIGLLLQGDLKGAEYAFRKVTEAEPEYADGWLNVARALIQEGETDAAKPYLDKAAQINSKLGRIWYFKALVQKADGDYDGAITSLQRVVQQYPRDRVVLAQLGRVLFLKREYGEAVKALEAALSVDPEDVTAHYNLMLAYRGLGQIDQAQREQRLFERFKADESSQALTAKPRMTSAEANNERQPIHDHESCLK